ncbi:SDR family oxidoreductase [Ktedonosporobacter rubrisoli]|uniref:SDR family oxidoreductase n=1 Tax=Ktedonosporobacter rubrisoli TaxID=2509675 RepID=A0A4P6JQS4_KTERU|nr:SDR family oxidoreductase [Ktedonosporobacter rubrisoli]QBD77654.1 SDR family oxidoreductase [Ktedonosporobacter rubrisoli]
MYTYTGKMALITGASSGIGEAFAHALASRGMHLILVARTEARLHELAQELTHAYGVRAEVIPADLSQEYATSTIVHEVQSRGLVVDMLVNNAGFGSYGHFTDVDLQRHHTQVMVNVTSVVDLTRAFLPGMAARGDGAIINIASISAFASIPYMAVYPASKSFVLSFSETLAAEYRDEGVRVMALCPGEVKTNFTNVSGNPSAPGPSMTTDEVVAFALKNLERGRSFVIPGAFNNMMSIVWRLLPRRFFANAVMKSLKSNPPSSVRAETGRKEVSAVK